MSKSAILKSSVVKKYWMALTGLFLCLFLIGHLLGNLQLLETGEEGRRAFNEYAYFMTHNPAIIVLSLLTYFSILFHAIDGILLTIKSKKARPVKYVYSKPNVYSSWTSRNMALLGSIILLFIAVHMSSFWYKSRVAGPIKLHVVQVKSQQDPSKVDSYYLTHTGAYLPVEDENTPEAMRQLVIKHRTDIYSKAEDLKVAEGYQDLHSLVLGYFGNTSVAKYGFPVNSMAWAAVLFYVLCMAALSFHLYHGFQSAFQSIGIRRGNYKNLIVKIGQVYAIVVPALFAIIPIYIYFTR